MNIDSRVEVTFSFNLTLKEDEARALAALPYYGDEQFLRFYYNSLGKTYLEPYEEGLRNLFKSIDDKLIPLLDKADTAIEAGEEATK